MFLLSLQWVFDFCAVFRGLTWVSSHDFRPRLRKLDFMVSQLCVKRLYRVMRVIIVTISLSVRWYLRKCFYRHLHKVFVCRKRVFFFLPFFLKAKQDFLIWKVQPGAAPLTVNGAGLWTVAALVSVSVTVQDEIILTDHKAAPHWSSAEQLQVVFLFFFFSSFLLLLLLHGEVTSDSSFLLLFQLWERLVHFTPSNSDSSVQGDFRFTEVVCLVRITSSET